MKPWRWNKIESRMRDGFPWSLIKNKNPNNQNKKPKFKEVVVYCNETVYTGACEVHFMSDNVSFRYWICLIFCIIVASWCMSIVYSYIFIGNTRVCTFEIVVFVIKVRSSEYSCGSCLYYISFLETFFNLYVVHCYLTSKLHYEYAP